jgi:hypothetical protein
LSIKTSTDPKIAETSARFLKNHISVIRNGSNSMNNLLYDFLAIKHRGTGVALLDTISRIIVEVYYWHPFIFNFISKILRVSNFQVRVKSIGILNVLFKFSSPELVVAFS